MVENKRTIAAILTTGLMLTTLLSAISVNAFTTITPISPNDTYNPGVERWAVLVGAAGDIYLHDDAIDLNETLVNHGWQADHIKVLTQPAFHRDQWHIRATRENIINAIRWMAEKEDEDDIVLFFFGCHGGYKEIYTGDSKTITCEELNNELDKFSSKNIAIIFNSCYSGSMVSIGSTVPVQEEQIAGVYDNNKGINTEGSEGLDKPGRVILMSSGRFEISWSSELLQNSIFTYFLIQGFEGKADDLNQDGWISAEEAFNYAKPRTTLFARLKLICFQHPRIYDGYEGDFNIVPIDDQQNNPIQNQNLLEENQNSQQTSNNYPVLITKAIINTI